MNRRGMTMIEMLIAMVVFSVVMAGAFSFLRSQGRGFLLGSERAATLQNLRYAANVLELDLRTMGGNVPDIQPFLVYAGQDVLAFNADYATNVKDDPFAVYYEPDAPAADVAALTSANKITIPLTAFSYPDTSYNAGPLNSPAETITFFFTLDSSTTRADDYVLYRKINDQRAEAIARYLLHTASEPFFKYFWLKTPTSAPQFVEEVDPSFLPLAHSEPIHGAPGDTAKFAWADSVRGVEINLSAWNGREGTASKSYAVTRVVRFPNAGLAVKKSCGDSPLLGTALIAAPDIPTNAIVLTWGQATDEQTGELDVVRYVIWRREVPATDWGTPFLSIPAGQPSYVYSDQQITSGKKYEYALAAQDCTPSLSSLAQSAPVTAP